MEPPMKWMLPLAVSPRPARYGVAIGSAAIAVVLVEFLLPSVGDQFPFLLLYPAVICTAWYGGFGPGLLATVLTALAGDFLLFEPRFTFAIARPGDQLAISLFLVVGGFISWLGEMILRANRQLENHARGIANQRDISEKRAAELDRLNESLRQSEERYRSLAIATAQIVWTTNPEGEVVEDMPMWRALTGKSEEELRGLGWVDTLHPEDREQTRAVWSVAVRARSVYETEYRIRKSDGEYRHFAARGVPVLQADGSVREWVGTCTDITERKRAEEALRRASAYNRRLLEASLDPLVTIGTDGKITDVNEATEAVTGYPLRRAYRQGLRRLLRRARGGPGGLHARVPRGAGPRLSPGDPAPGRARHAGGVQRFGVSGRGGPGRRRLRGGPRHHRSEARRGRAAPDVAPHRPGP